MFGKLRGQLAKLLLKAEYEKLEKARDGYLSGSDPARAFRRQMKGFEPKSIDSTDDIELMYEAEDGLESFLADIKAVSDNKSLQEVIKVLKRNQIMHIALETQNIEQVNFGRATVNGFLLLEEEIDRLVGIYAQKHTTEDKYDTNEVV